MSAWGVGDLRTSDCGATIYKELGCGRELANIVLHTMCGRHLRAWKLESLCGSNWRLGCLQLLGLEIGCGHWLQLRWLWRRSIAIVTFPDHLASIFAGAVLAIPIPAHIVMMMIVMVIG